MSSKTYLVKLTPSSYFFFGGENTFGSGEGRNYLVRSNYFPQQTGILGLLRYAILLADGKLAAPGQKGLSEEVLPLIGKSSFDPGNTEGYGAIRKISPVFLLDSDVRKILPGALNWGMKLEKTEGSSAHFGNSHGQAHRLIGPDGNPFDPKNSLLETLATESGEMLFYDQSDMEDWIGRKGEGRRAWSGDIVFKEHGQVGIRKNLHRTKEKAFYKQSFWYLPPGWCFAFFVELNQADEQSLLPTETLVTAGGERSIFRFTSESVQGNFEENARFPLATNALPDDEQEKIVLISDAYLPDGIYSDCDFAITKTTPFRYQKTATLTTNRYFDLNKKESPTPSQRFTLLKRGSVLYAKPGQKQSLIDKLKDQTAFRNIGYNYFAEA